MDPLQGISSQNTREATLRRWLAKPPSRAVRVRLVAVDGALVLGEWDRDSIRPDLGVEINELAGDHLAESNSARQDYLLVFEGDDGRALSTKKFAVRAARDEEDGARSLAEQIDGSANGVTMQMQTQLERLFRMNFTCLSATMQMQLTMLDKLTDKFLASEERTDHAREQLHELREALVTMASAEERGETQPEMTEGQKRFWKLMEQYGPMIVARLASGGGTPPQAPAE